MDAKEILKNLELAISDLNAKIIKLENENQKLKNGEFGLCRLVVTLIKELNKYEPITIMDRFIGYAFDVTGESRDDLV